MLINRNIARLNNRIEDRLIRHTPLVEFLFCDDFITAEAAPLTSTRTAEPGPGIATIVDTGNNADIVGEEFVISGFVGDGDPGYWTDAQTRVAGLGVLCVSVMMDDITLGFDNNQSGLPGGFPAWRNNVVNFRSTSLAVIGNLDTSVEYSMFTILRAVGNFLVIKGGLFLDWTLLWVEVAGATATLFGSWALDFGRIGDSTLDTLRISQLPSPWDTDDGIATSTLDGARSAGDTFTHEADAILEFIATTIPSAGQIEYEFRRQGAGDKLRVTIDSAGAIDLDKVVATVVTQLDTDAGPVTNGKRIVIIADGADINVYEDNALTLTTAGGVFTSETAGELESLGTAGAVDDHKAWPRVISSEALAQLNAVVTA